MAEGFEMNPTGTYHRRLQNQGTSNDADVDVFVTPVPTPLVDLCHVNTMAPNDTDRQRELSPVAPHPLPARPLSQWDVASLIINKMIGTGIFTAPPSVLLMAGSPGLAFSLWLLGFAYTIVSMLFYLEYARKLPHTGGELIYTDEIQPGPNFLAYRIYAFYFVLLYNTATNCMRFADYVLKCVTDPGTDEDERLLRSLAVVILTFFCALHFRSARMTRMLNIALAAFKIAILLVVIVSGAIRAPQMKINWSDPPSDGASSTAAAFLLILFSFWGWENVTFVAGEIENRDILKWGSIVAVSIVGILYMLVNIVFVRLNSLPRSSFFPVLQANHGSSKLTAVAYSDGVMQYVPLFFGKSRVAQQGWDVIIAISAGGSLLSVIYSSARVKQAIDKSNLFLWSRLLSIESLHKIPEVGLVLHWIFSVIFISVAAAIENVEDAITFPGSLQAYASGVIGVFVGVGSLFLERDDIPGPTRLPGERSWATGTGIFHTPARRFFLSAVYILFNSYIIILTALPPYQNPDGSTREIKGWIYPATVGSTILAGSLYYWAAFSSRDISVFKPTKAKATVAVEPTHDKAYGCRKYVMVTFNNLVGYDSAITSVGSGAPPPNLMDSEIPVDIDNECLPEDIQTDLTSGTAGESQGPGAKIADTRISRKRTKTGCLTCRRRRIKCGEERPTCRNCIKSKRQCEGYNQRVIFKDPLGIYRIPASATAANQSLNAVPARGLSFSSQYNQFHHVTHAQHTSLPNIAPKTNSALKGPPSGLHVLSSVHSPRDVDFLGYFEDDQIPESFQNAASPTSFPQGPDVSNFDFNLFSDPLDIERSGSFGQHSPKSCEFCAARADHLQGPGMVCGCPSSTLVMGEQTSEDILNNSGTTVKADSYPTSLAQDKVVNNAPQPILGHEAFTSSPPFIREQTSEDVLSNSGTAVHVDSNTALSKQHNMVNNAPRPTLGHEVFIPSPLPRGEQISEDVLNSSGTAAKANSKLSDFQVSKPQIGPGCEVNLESSRGLRSEKTFYYGKSVLSIGKSLVLLITLKLRNGVSKALRPSVPPGYHRIEWSCPCGVNLYADFNLANLAGALEAEEILKRPNKTHSPTTPGLQFSKSRAGLPQITPTTPSYASRQPSTSSQSSNWSSSNNECASQSSPATSVSSLSIVGTPTFLELCVNTGKHLKRLCEIELTNVRSDGDMFKIIKDQYIHLRAFRTKFWLLVPSTISWVRFSVENRHRIGILQKPLAVPPKDEVDAKNWIYDPCPLNGDPPMPSHLFLHYLECLEPSCNLFWMLRLPRKLNYSIINAGNSSASFGWGIHIEEGPNWVLILSLNLAAVIISGLAALLWDLFVHDFQGAFGFASWIVTVMNSLLMIYLVKWKQY